MQHPIVKRLSTNPQFVALRQAVTAAPSLAQKLSVVDTAGGYYAPGFALAEGPKMRAVLALMVLEDGLADLPAKWGDADHDTRTPGQVAAEVLHAALLGAADVGLLPGLADIGPGAVAAALAGGPAVVLSLQLAKRYGLAGATIADTVQTDMSLATALDLLASVDPGAAEAVRKGAIAAGAAHAESYGAALRARFVKDFTTFANPFSNPIWGDYAKAAAAVAGVVVLFKVLQR